MVTNNKLLNCPHLRFPEFKDEWQQTTLGEVASILGGGTPRTEIQEYWNGDIQWFTPSEIGLSKFVSHSDRTITTEGLNNSGAKLLPIGTILLTTRATIGEVSIATIPCTTNQGFQSLVVDSRYTNTEFVYQKVQTLKNELLTRANGSTFKEISASEIRSLPIAVPSLEEQKKIASFLSLLDERIEVQRQTIKERKNQKKALLSQIFSQSLRFPGFSDDWQQTTLGEVADIPRGERVTKSDLIENGVYPVVSGGKEPMGYTNKYNQDSFTTTIAQYGTAGYIQWQRTPFWANDVCYILKPNSPNLIPVYLYNLILGKQLDIYRLVNTAAVPAHLPKERLLSLPIAVPLLEEQEKIASFLSLIDERIEMEEQLLRKYEEQKRYLLRKMFV